MAATGRKRILVACAVSLWVGVTAPVAGAAEKMLGADDVGLPVVSKPHRSTVIAVDSVDDACTPADGVERDARVASFAADAGDPSSGARMNQVVFEFGSAGGAKAFYADVLAAERQRAACGSTTKASDLDLTKGPKGIGTARFTVSSDEEIEGETRRVVSVEVLAGSRVTKLIFIDWDDTLPSTAAVVKRAVKRLG